MASKNDNQMMKVIRRLKQKILIVMKQRDTAIEEARIANESRDVAIDVLRDGGPWSSFGGARTGIGMGERRAHHAAAGRTRSCVSLDSRTVDRTTVDV